MRANTISIIGAPETGKIIRLDTRQDRENQGCSILTFKSDPPFQQFLISAQFNTSHYLSGVSTICQKLAQNYGYHVIDPEALVQHEIETQTPRGREAKELLDRGLPVPDEVVTQIVIDAVKQLDKGTKIVMDNFPLTAAQAEAFEAFREIEHFFEVRVPKEVLAARLLGRLYHEPSGRMYNLDYNPPVRPMLDDITGEPLTERVDIDYETFEKKYEDYIQRKRSVHMYFLKASMYFDMPHTTTLLIWLVHIDPYVNLMPAMESPTKQRRPTMEEVAIAIAEEEEKNERGEGTGFPYKF